MTKSEISMIYDQVVETEANSRVKFPEHLFKRDWVLFFAGMEKDTNVDDKLKLWEIVAKGIDKRVDVVDEKGNVLFTVPSLIMHDGLSSTAIRSDKLFGLMTEYAKYRSVTEAQGIKFLGNVQEGFINKVTSDKNMRNLFNEWMAILSRYPDIIKTNNGRVTSANKKTTGFIPDELEEF